MKKVMKLTLLICFVLLACALIFTACDSDSESKKSDENVTDDSSADDDDKNPGNNIWGDQDDDDENPGNNLWGDQENEKSLLEYILNEDEKSYTVSGIGDCTDTEIVIPSTYKGLPVTAIGWLAFSKNSTLVSVVIPEGVIDIAYGAFYMCNNLETVKLPNTITSMGEEVFNYCPKLKVNTYENVNYVGNDANPYLVLLDVADKALTEYKIHEDTKLISPEAFSGCSSLESVTIPDSVTVIEDSAFSGCEALKNVKLSKNITKIQSSSFSSCTALTEVTIPDSVKIIEQRAFAGCENLKTISIPGGIEYIGPEAFNGCALTYTQIDNGLFLGNETTPCIVFIGLVDKEVTTYEIPSSVKIIYDQAFSGCYVLTKINIPSSVTAIGDSAFNGCYKLNEISIPDSVKNFGEGAFAACRELTAITLPTGITEISDYMLQDCSSLTTITIPNSVTEIGKYAFRNCEALTTLYISDNVIEFNDNALEECNSLVYNEYENGKYLGSEKNQYLVFVEVIDDTVKTLNIHPSTKLIISDSASFCDNIKSINIPEGVASIQNSAFAHCAELTEIVIPSTVKYFGQNFLHMCEKLTKITYNGTIDQFKFACENGGVDSQVWWGTIGTYTIHCSDGDYTIEE